MKWQVICISSCITINVKRKKKRVEPPIGTSKVIRITKSGKFFLVESAIKGFGFRNLAQGIRNPTKMGIRNPCPTAKKSGIHSLESRMQDCLGLPCMKRHQAWLTAQSNLHKALFLYSPLFLQHVCCLNSP